MSYNFSSINEFSLIPIHMKFVILEIESHGIGPQLFLTIKLTSYQGCPGGWVILQWDISHWLISQTKGLSLVHNIWRVLCQQVYHEKEQGRSLDLGHGSPARPEQDWEELRLQAVTSCHAPRRQAVSVLAATSCPDRVQLTTQYQASAAPLNSRLPICNHF